MPDALVAAPAGFVPSVAIAFGSAGATATAVDPAHPLPTTATLATASSTPLTGSLSASGSVGPFVPQLGRAIRLSLAGTWSGVATVLRSTDGGTTRLPLTVAGQPWGVFAANACEPIADEGDAAASYYLAVTLVAGTLVYRVAQ